MSRLFLKVKDIHLQSAPVDTNVKVKIWGQCFSGRTQVSDSTQKVNLISVGSSMTRTSFSKIITTYCAYILVVLISLIPLPLLSILPFQTIQVPS